MHHHYTFDLKESVMSHVRQSCQLWILMFFVREREAKRRKRKRESARETAREREREGSRLCVLISYRVFVRERRKEDLSARPAFSFSLICCCHFDLLLLVGFVVVSLICCCCFDLLLLFWFVLVSWICCCCFDLFLLFWFVLVVLICSC